MQKIIPIKELASKTSQLMQYCEETGEPIFITKNGYGAGVLLSMEAYERSLAMSHIQKQVESSLEDYAQGKVKDAFTCIEELNNKYGE